MKNLASISVILLLLVTWNSSSQIITSKKEAQKRGVYKSNSKSRTSNKDVKEKEISDNIAIEKEKSKFEDKNIDFVSTTHESYLAQQIIYNALEYSGVNYRGGGTTKSGMDCSGLVFTTFKIFDILLPRSSHEQARIGRKLNLNEIKKGDLVFFKNNPKRNSINHVGLVVETEDGDIKFIHSTLQKGVIISSIKEPYYERTFVQANRIVEY